MNMLDENSKSDSVSSFARPQAEIEALARETHTESKVVKEFYEKELAQLEATATIRPYISVIAWRTVATTLRKGAVQRDRRRHQ